MSAALALAGAPPLGAWPLAALVSGPALLLLWVASINLRRVRPVSPLPEVVPGPPTGQGAGPAGVSALVPARDEEEAIGPCIEALLAEPVGEVLVFDDESRDRTSAIVLALAARDPRVRLLRAPGPLPAGQAGKSRGCAALAEAARGEVLLFVDADVRVERGAIAGLLAARAAAGAEVVTALPRQLLGSFAERLVVPLLHLVYWALAPLWLIPRVRDPRVTAANGQLLLVTKAGYRKFGGHAHPAVRGAVVEDQAFCRAAKSAGLRLLFADAQRLARCRMYRSAAEVRQGFVKNLYLGVGGTPLRLAAVVVVLGWGLLLPFLALPLAPAAAVPGVAALLLLRFLLARRFGQPLWATALLHPLSIAALFGIALESAVRAHRGQLAWRGRLYGLREGGAMETAQDAPAAPRLPEGAP